LLTQTSTQIRNQADSIAQQVNLPINLPVGVHVTAIVQHVDGAIKLYATDEGASLTPAIATKNSSEDRDPSM
jgi:hypothetical protein